MDRRRFLAAGGAVAGAFALGLTACSDGGSDASDAAEATSTTAATGGPASPVRADDLVDEQQLLDWIQELVDLGVRRPGFDGDQKAQDWAEAQLAAAGLDLPRRERFTHERWEAVRWSLTAFPAGAPPRNLDAYPLAQSPSTLGLRVNLRPFAEGTYWSEGQAAALMRAPRLTIPADLVATGGSAPDDPDGRTIDLEGSLAGATQTMPTSEALGREVDLAAAAGAVAFVGALDDDPADGFRHYAPTVGEPPAIPGVWIRGSDGEWLQDQLNAGTVEVELTVDATRKGAESFTILGELPGADEQTVVIGAHHDAPWASAVGNASGVALVLAQARYWAAQAQEDRPHRLLFVVHGGDLAGGAGFEQFLQDHQRELDDVVLNVQLEHAALDADGAPVPRWWFTSRNPDLEGSVLDALAAEEVDRSLLVAPDGFGPQPPTAAAGYVAAGVPIVQFHAAPPYLYDEIDTVDKVDREGLLAITRAVVRIVAATAGTAAEELRAGIVSEGSTPAEPEPAD